jgi:ketosteroid isomerase-like protein
MHEMQENLRIVTALYEALETKDMTTLMELIDPEVEIIQTELLPWGGHYRGHQGLVDFFGKLTAHIKSQPEPVEFVQAGDHIVAIGNVRGQVNATGRTFDVRIVHVWTIRNGKALRFEAYIDTPQMLQALAS